MDSLLNELKGNENKIKSHIELMKNTQNDAIEQKVNEKETV